MIEFAEHDLLILDGRRYVIVQIDTSQATLEDLITGRQREIAHASLASAVRVDSDESAASDLSVIADLARCSPEHLEHALKIQSAIESVREETARTTPLADAVHGLLRDDFGIELSVRRVYRLLKAHEKLISFSMVGALLITAVLLADSERVGGLDRAVQRHIALPVGPLLLSGIALGLLINGTYLLARALFLPREGIGIRDRAAEQDSTTKTPSQTTETSA